MRTKETKSSYNQVINPHLNTRTGRASKDVPLPICCPLDFFSTLKLPQRNCIKMLGEQGVVCSGSDSPPQSHSAHARLSFQQGSPGDEDLGCHPEAERAAWEGTSPAGSRSAVGREQLRGTRCVETDRLQGLAALVTRIPLQSLQVLDAMLQSVMDKERRAVTRMWITCSGSSPSTETPFTSTSLSPAYNSPRQTGTQNKERCQTTGKKGGSHPNTT